MIWFTLALFVVSFLIVTLLTPKPEVENARAQSLDDVNFPRATENAPIPMVLGKVRMTAPNVIWYGNFRTIPIIEKIKTGLFSSKKVIVGYRYFLTMDLALAMGPGITCREIYVDDKIAWTGNTGGGAVVGISGVGISFGGYRQGGEMSMSGNFYSGAFDLINQPVDDIIEGQVGAGNVPAYLGTSHISLDGELGESAQLRKMAFVLERYTNSLGLINNGKIGDDMNPAEALYQIMTDTWSGLGISPSLIDVSTLQDIGQVLYDENNGCSVQVTAEATGKKVVEEILRQIDGVAYQDPATGRIVFKLIRDDYDPDLLDIYDEDSIVKIENFSRSGWDEVMAQVKISFPQRDKDSDAIAISQDMATAGMIGRLRSTTIAMPFCYNKSLANRLASRERAQLSVPLFRMTLQMNRNANRLRPGDVFKVSWSDYNIEQIVMRVQEFDFGSLLDGKLVIRCLQDNFALDTVVFSPPPDSGWVPPIVDPQEILVSDILEMPRFFMNRVQFPIPDGNAGVIPLARKPSSASSTYDLLAGDVSGALDVREPQQVSYPPNGTLLSSYEKYSGFAGGIDTAGFNLINVSNGVDFEAATDAADLRLGESGLLYANGEFMGFLGVTDNGDGSWTLSNIYRGLLGTNAKTHPAGTRVWQIKPELFGEGTLDDLAEDETLYYKLLDRVGPESIDPDDIAEASQLMTRWARRGQRVRNLLLDGNRTNVVIDDTSGTLPLTWARSNREASQIAYETDADQVPDISDADSETYDIEVYANSSLVTALSQTGVAGPTSHDIDFSTVTFVGPGEIRVITRWNYTSGDILSIGYGFLPITFDQEIFVFNMPILGDGIDNAYTTAAWTQDSGAGILTVDVNGYTSSGSAGGVWYQDISVPVSVQASIDANASTLYFEYVHYQDFANDKSGMRVEYYDGSSLLLGTDDLGIRNLTELKAPYKFFLNFVPIPANTRTIRIIQEHVFVLGDVANANIGLIDGQIWLDNGDQLLVDSDFALADPSWVMERSMFIENPTTRHNTWNGNAPNLNYSMLSCGTDSEARATQTVNVSAYSVQIDANNATASVLLDCIKTFGDGDFMDVDLDFLDASDALISTDSGELTIAPVGQNQTYRVTRRQIAIPSGTRKIVFAVTGKLLGGSLINCIAFNSKLWIHT